MKILSQDKVFHIQGSLQGHYGCKMFTLTFKQKEGICAKYKLKSEVKTMSITT